VPPPI